jgi:hypothetical protein
LIETLIVEIKNKISWFHLHKTLFSVLLKAMATDKPGVMTFLNPEVYKRLVTFKETKQLRSLSHAAELALGEYFGVAIAPCYPPPAIVTFSRHAAIARNINLPRLTNSSLIMSLSIRQC